MVELGLTPTRECVFCYSVMLGTTQWIIILDLGICILLGLELINVGPFFGDPNFKFDGRHHKQNIVSFTHFCVEPGHNLISDRMLSVNWLNDCYGGDIWSISMSGALIRLVTWVTQSYALYVWTHGSRILHLSSG